MRRSHGDLLIDCWHEAMMRSKSPTYWRILQSNAHLCQCAACPEVFEELFRRGTNRPMAPTAPSSMRSSPRRKRGPELLRKLDAVAATRFEEAAPERILQPPSAPFQTYPKPGISVSPILRRCWVDRSRVSPRVGRNWVQPWAGHQIDKVAGMRRAASSWRPVAHQLSAGFVPIRKKGKLPQCHGVNRYSVEYGLDEMEMHEDAVTQAERVILIDDLLPPAVRRAR